MYCTSHGPLGRAVLLSLVAGSMLACASPLVVYRPAAAVLAEEKGGPLELRLTTGERYIIGSARVQNDTLYGVRLASSASEKAQVAVPVSVIASLAKTERGLTVGSAGVVGLTIGVLLGALGIIGLILAYSTST